MNMPILTCAQKMEFNVDPLTIDRVEALAAIDGLTLDAWFRRMVDELTGLGSRHMTQDHAFFPIRPAVASIIEVMASKIGSLQAKAQQCLERIKAVKSAPVVAEPDQPAKKKKRGLHLLKSEAEVDTA